ncbi:MAG: hypothetical protein AMS25_05875 [Gemmatimonas sp. SM23_52]|nr:MAG: hypothetical protein AMS25_05875 [Gemmatimonas sp. SM23_52]
MGILSWIILGFVAGTIARILHPGRDRGGCLLTILLGIGGALVGGYIGTMLGWGRVSGFDLRSLALAVLGALLLLIAYRVLFGRRR